MANSVERYSSAPITQSIYTEDDYDPKTGVLLPGRRKKIPLGTYPPAINEQLNMGARPMFPPEEHSAEPQAIDGEPSSPPQEQQQQTVDDPMEIDSNALVQLDEEIPTVESFNRAVLGHHDPSDKFVPGSAAERRAQRGGAGGVGAPVHVAAGPVTRTAFTPAGLMSDNHHIAAVSWIENRHPDEEAIMEHYFEQWKAKREGKYDPFEDPPVYLTDLIPKIVLVVSRTFTKQEAEVEGGRRIQNYVEALHRETDMNVIPLYCGKPQPFPVSDRVRGIYKDPVLQQTMDQFYIGQEAGADDVYNRMEKDKAQGLQQKEESRRQALLEREKAPSSSAALPSADLPPPPPPKKKMWGDESDDDNPPPQASNERAVDESSHNFYRRMQGLPAKTEPEPAPVMDIDAFHRQREEEAANFFQQPQPTTTHHQRQGGKGRSRRARQAVGAGGSSKNAKSRMGQLAFI